MKKESKYGVSLTEKIINEQNEFNQRLNTVHLPEKILNALKEVGDMIILGNKVKDKFSKIEGIATARTTYLFGCSRICVEFINKKDGEIHEIWFDEQRLDKKSKAPIGGYYSPPTRRSISRR